MLRFVLDTNVVLDLHHWANLEALPLPCHKDRDVQKFLELAARAGTDILVSKDKALPKLTGRPRLAFRIVKQAACALLPKPSETTAHD